MNAVDQHRIAAAVREILAALGANPDSDAVRDTPGRVAQSYAEWAYGVGADPLPLLRDTVPVGEHTGEIVAVRALTFTSLCEHHLLPFHGTAHIAYLPGERVVGLGALPRAISLIAAKPQVQERLGSEIAEALTRGIGAAGALVVLEARHGCLSDRGAKQTAAIVTTVAATGELVSGARRQEALSLLCGTVPEEQPLNATAEEQP